MYYAHFGLSQPPFRITPDTEFFFSGGNRGPILDALIYAIGQGEGIIKVTGEVGSGKTMLCSMLQTRLPPNVDTVYIANPSVSPEEILHAIALELHLKPPRDAGHLEVMQMLHHYLLDRHAQGKQVVMFVEESQSMPIATLEEIRLLSNLETAHSKLLQIVLFGQPELDENLRQQNIRQLRERITHSFRLSPLKNEEILDYLGFRLRAAGYRGPDLFSPPVINAIARSSGGLTRRINLIADKALLAAFSENTHTVKLKHVKAAVRDSAFSDSAGPHSRYRIGVALALIAVGTGIGVALYGLLQYYDGNFSRPSRAPATGVAPSSPPLTQDVRSDSTSAADANTHPATTSAVVQPTPIEKPVAPAGLPLKQEVALTVSADLHTAATDADLLEARLTATQDWLAQQDKNTYSIQLLGADDPQQLKNHLNAIRKYIEISDIFVYRTIAKQKPSLTVLYGSFRDRRAAFDALARLPMPLKAHNPILRTVQGIRGEIARHQPS
jgi:MSHA biogenesis protein MshM